MLAHVEASPHGGSLTVLIRLGALLPLALVVAWSLLPSARRPFDPARGLRSAAALTLVAAGLLHLALVPEHARERAAAGVFFALAGGAQVALAGAVAWRRSGAPTLLAVIALNAGLVAVYVASRVGSLPFGVEREAVDAVGLLTKLPEVAGTGLAAMAITGRPRRVRVDAGTVLASVVLALALLARPVYDLGPDAAQLAAAVVAALAVGALMGVRAGGDVADAVRDAAALAILVRAPGVLPFVLGGALVVVARQVGRRLARPLLAPLAVAALAVLGIPGADARLEIFHASHPGEPAAAVLAVAVAGLLAVLAWRQGALAVVAAFYAAHLGLQWVRLVAGHTSIEAIEVPGVSLGLLVIVVVAMADPQFVEGRRAAMVLAGLLAGAADVVCRDRGIPYPALYGVAMAVAIVGLAETVLGRGRTNDARGERVSRPLRVG